MGKQLQRKKNRLTFKMQFVLRNKQLKVKLLLFSKKKLNGCKSDNKKDINFWKNNKNAKSQAQENENEKIKKKH